MEWTADLKADLTRRWAAGHSAGVIGKDYGVTRNSIIGAVHRLGLPKRVTTITTLGQPPFPLAAPVRVRKAVPTKPRPKLMRAKMLPSLKIVPLPAEGIWAPLPDVTPVHLEDHRDGQCRWMIGDVHDHLYCGAQCASGKHFCPTHHAVAYRPVASAENKSLRHAERLGRAA